MSMGWGRTMIEYLVKNSLLSGLKRCRDGKTNCHFWPFASDGVLQTFQYFNVVNLVDCGASRKVLVVNNTPTIKKTVNIALTFDRTW